MMHDLGVNWAIIGHSERRELFNESDQVSITYLNYFFYSLNLIKNRILLKRLLLLLEIN